jgi:uncharacterized protein YehS (DUF1456 family)
MVVDKNIKKEKLVYEMEMNPVVRFLKKQPCDLTKEDIIRFIQENRSEQFRHICDPQVPDCFRGPVQQFRLTESNVHLL